MITITAKLDSAISESRDKILGIITITNDGMLSVETAGRRASYDVKISKGGNAVNQTLFECKIKNFPRKQKNIWDLLYLVLQQQQSAKNNKKRRLKRIKGDISINDMINSIVGNKNVGELVIHDIGIQPKIPFDYKEDTCYFNKWDSNNPLRGHCDVVAFFMCKYFHFDIYKVKIGRSYHYFNMAYGMVLDFTIKQFETPIAYENRIAVDIKKLYKSIKKRYGIFEERNLHLVEQHKKRIVV